MVVGTGEGTLHFIHTQTGREVKSLISSCDGISSCVFLKDGRLATTSFDGRIEVWDIENGCRTAFIDGHTNTITGSDVTADKKHLATVSLDCMIKSLCGHTRSVRSLSFSPYSSMLCSGSVSGEVRVWSVPTSTCVGCFQAHCEATESLTFLEEGSMLLSAGSDHMWMQEPPLKKLKAVTSQPAALCVAVNGDYVAVGYHADGIKLFSLRSGEKLWASVDLDVSVPCMLWVVLEAEQTDTDLLVSGGSDKCLRVWKRKQEEEGMMEVLEMVGVFGVQSGTIQALAQNSTYLATASGCRLLPVPLLEEGVFQKLAVGLGVELDSILNPKRPHKLIFDDTSPNQYSTSTLLAFESDWSSLPFTNPATGPSIWPIKTHSHFISPYNLRKISLEIFLGPVLTFQLDKEKTGHSGDSQENSSATGKPKTKENEKEAGSIEEDSTVSNKKSSGQKENAVVGAMSKLISFRQKKDTEDAKRLKENEKQVGEKSKPEGKDVTTTEKKEKPAKPPAVPARPSEEAASDDVGLNADVESASKEEKNEEETKVTKKKKHNPFMPDVKVDNTG
ncbi:nuclear receptor co-repressor 2 [Sarotherodon galilaeus]